MRKLIFSINVSLDGFADHTVAIADDELHSFFAEQLNATGICLFGRKTYKLMESYWPNTRQNPKATEGMIRFADRFNAIPKIVFSRTLEKAGWSNTRLVRDDMITEVTKLKQQSGKNLSIGGINAAQTLMRHSLIDEYVFLVHPVIAGGGRRLFPGDNSTEVRHLKLIETEKFKSGVVVLHGEGVKK